MRNTCKMHRSKAEVDKHVESLVAKLSLKEFKSRAYSIARLYYDAGDYASCRRYVEQYLSVKESDAAAHKLLGQALTKLGEKERALEQYKTSLDIDSGQTNLILDICELLSDDEVFIDPGRARYWCELAEKKFPSHPATFNLRERLLTQADSDPAALVRLLRAELEQRPREASLHTRLLKQHLNTNNYKDAFDHSFDTEFGDNDTFRNNYAWYEALSEVLALDEEGRARGEWRRRLLELTVAERLCSLSLTDVPSASCKSIVESAIALHRYDQELQRVYAAGPAAGGVDFHEALLHHHRGQFSFYAACFLLRKAKKDQLSWREAVRPSSPLFLLAWHSTPIDLNAPWLTHAPEHQKSAAKRWHLEASYRCSQAGHCLLAGVQEKSHTFVDRVSQFCSGNHWKDKLYKKLFTSNDQLSQSKTSHLLSNNFQNPTLTLPRRSDVQRYDVDAQKMFPSSLHHVVWILINYKNYAQFKCVLFDTLQPASQNYPNCGPETLSKLDVEAFLYAAALTAQHQRKDAPHFYQPSDYPELLPANISDLLCSLAQIKWWDCAHKVSQKQVHVDTSDIRVTLRRGIEVVRCVDNHGLDPQLLCKLAAIFSERAKLSAERVDEKEHLQARAAVYYSAAIPLLERLKNRMFTRMPEKRMFEFTSKDLSAKDIMALIDESKLYMGESYMNERENEKAIEMLTDLKSARGSYLLSKVYTQMAFDEIGSSKEHLTSEDRSRHIILLSKAKNMAYNTNERLKSSKDDGLYAETLNLIEKIESAMSRINPDNSHDYDGKYSSDENSSGESQVEHLILPQRHSNSLFCNVSSTPKHRSHSNTTHYRSAIDSHLLDSSRADRKHLDRIESQIKVLHKKDSSMNSFMEHTKSWIEENRNLGEEVRDLKNNLAEIIISKINTNVQDTVDQFKMLKLSVDQVKDKIGEYRDECRNDVSDLKKEVADLKKEVSKLKSSDQTIDESDLYHLEDYQASETTPNFGAQLPFTAPQVMPQFNQRLVPPVALTPAAYSIYGQNLYSLYNQFSQLAQAPPAPLFDPARAPVTYPPVFPTADQIFPEVPHFHPPPVVPAPIQPPAPAVSRPAPAVQNKEVAKQLPVNVVITSSDPMPTRTSAPQPVLSVTIPPHHIKNSPHNYQIPLPTSGANPLMSSVFNTGIVSSAAASVSTPKPFAGWNQTATFSTAPTLASNATPKVSSTFDSSNFNLFNTSKSGDAVDSPKTSLGGLNISFTSPNISANKSRTLSEKSNTSVENYDPCPDFKPIIPLPAEVQVTTGEEDETTIFSARAKLFRFVDKQWKERGLGGMKLLKHNVTGKVRVLMRREQIHKICANHNITPDMDLQPMKNESKAYIWVANDFADETVVLEKFCVRFKTADIAKEFYETFERARKEMKHTTEGGNKSQLNQKDNKTTNTPTSASTTFTNTKPLTDKPVLGGFTFSSAPTFKTSKESERKDEIKIEDKTVKPNLFSGLNFKTQTSSPFTNIFNTAPVVETVNIPAAPVPADSSSKLNTSDVVEEFEPSVDFKPVVPLPALVEQKTGEENETVAFEHRAKLLRFDAATKEWKERGLGNIKILVNKSNNQKVRLLMRREIVMKVCCNHAITKDMKFEKMPNQDKAITWCAKDFSEGELTAETFCIRFKTAPICDDFMMAIRDVQNKLRSPDSTAKAEKSTPKQTIGFGEQFKPKPGTWSCNACYTNNLQIATKCIACEQPKEVKESTKPEKSTPKQTIGFGEQFKPKPGTWSCNACYTNNLQIATKCIACEQPKEVKESTEKPKAVSEAHLPLSVANWGDKFKPKAGSWECAQCLIRNDAQVDYCSACESPRDPSKPKKETKLILDVPGAPAFSFGIPKTAEPNKVPTAAPVLNFGVNSQTKAPGTFTFNPTAPMAGGPFTAAVPNTEASSRTQPFGQFSKSTASPVSPFSTPAKDSPTSIPFAKEGCNFGFVMKPKAGKGKSPLKSPQSDRGNDSDDNYEEDEGHHIHFAPIIPLPDKVEVTTGEENEIELYSHRAKLFRFVSREWKERGIGNVKILKHKDTGKLRVLMRREQIHKICLNHALTSDINYTRKDDKSWLFTANDFSEGELQLQQFCLRFKSNDIAEDFKKAADDARDGDSIETKDQQQKKVEMDDVVFVKEIQATPDEKKRAKELMLPENFFTYLTKEPCPGCSGCEQNEDAALAPPSPMPLHLTTPSKVSVSPSNSIFATPMASNKSSDQTLFQTPMGGSDDDRSWKSEDKNASLDKENSTPNTKNIGAPSTTAFTAFRNATAEVSSTTRPFLLPTPRLNLDESSHQSNEPKIIFGQKKPEVKSIFGLTSDQTPALFNQKFDSKPMFGSVGEQKSMPTFGSVANSCNETKPAFGSISSQKPEAKLMFPAEGDQKSIFKVPTIQSFESKSMFGSDKSLTKPTFGSPNEIVFGVTNEQKAEVKSIFDFTNEQKTDVKTVFGSTTDQKPEVKSIFGSIDNQNSQAKSIFATHQNLDTKSLFGMANQKPEAKSMFGLTADQKPEVKSIFGSTTDQKSEAKSIFGSTTDQKPEAKSIFGSTAGQKPEAKSIFGSTADQKPEAKSIFGSTADQKPEAKSIFGSTADQKPEVKSTFGSTADQKSEAKSIFGSSANQKPEAKSIFGFSTAKPSANNPVFGAATTDDKPVFASSIGSGSIFGGKGMEFGFSAKNLATQELSTATNGNNENKTNPAPFSSDTGLTFASLSSANGAPGLLNTKNKPDNFKWEGTGQKLFSSKTEKDTVEKSSGKADKSVEEAGDADEEEYDPHYEPIVPLPDKIEVTTGEEDEEKVFGERAKLYRYDEKAHEWKERGVGEMKLLYHPAKKTYRLILRREQVHKLVLNTLLHKDLELLPMKNSETAWTWAAANYAESTGDMETLACRFKSVELARAFRDAVVDSVRKLQVADAVAYRERQESAAAAPAPAPLFKFTATPVTTTAAPVAAPEQEQHTEEEEEEEEGDEGHEYEHDYEDYGDGYQDYYDQEEGDSVAAEAYGSARITTPNTGEAETCDSALLQLVFDPEIYAHKLTLTNDTTKEILADIMLLPDVPFEVTGQVCKWSGADYTSGDEVNKEIVLTCTSAEEADVFYNTMLHYQHLED